MDDYRTIHFDLTREEEERLVDMFERQFPKPDSTITIEELMALPEAEYRNMQIAVMVLKGLKIGIEMCSPKDREEKVVLGLTEEELLENLGEVDYNDDHYKKIDDEEAYW